MGIDGIGKKAPPVPGAGGTTGAGRATETGGTFEVPKAAAATQTAPVEASARSPLDRLKAGEIDLTGYVDAKVHEATAHLGPLPAARLDAIRSALRDRLASDPLLVDLVRTATGHAPAPLGDD
jgi:hypothetical protein